MSSSRPSSPSFLVSVGLPQKSRSLRSVLSRGRELGHHVGELRDPALQVGDELASPDLMLGFGGPALYSVSLIVSPPSRVGVVGLGPRGCSRTPGASCFYGIGLPALSSIHFFAIASE